jgi:hypothetical protein
MGASASLGRVAVEASYFSTQSLCSLVDRVGLEPTYPNRTAFTAPRFCRSPICPLQTLAARPRLERGFPEPNSGVLPIRRTGSMAAPAGLEPASPDRQSGSFTHGQRRLTHLASLLPHGREKVAEGRMRVGGSERVPLAQLHPEPRPLIRSLRDHLLLRLGEKAAHHPFTHTTWRRVCTTSIKSDCAAMTASMSL